MNFLKLSKIIQSKYIQNKRFYSIMSKSKKFPKNCNFIILSKRNFSNSSKKFFKNDKDKNTFIFYSTLGLLVIGSATVLGNMMKKENPIYSQAIMHINSHPELTKLLGKPQFRNGQLKGGVVLGNVSYEFPISGPNGKGDVKIYGKKINDNEWKIIDLTVTINNQNFILISDGKQIYKSDVDCFDGEFYNENQPIIGKLPEKEKPVIILNPSKRNADIDINDVTSTTQSLDQYPWYYKVIFMAVLGIGVGFISAKAFVSFQKIKFKNSDLVNNALDLVVKNERVVNIFGTPIKFKGKSDGVLDKNFGKLTQPIEGPNCMGIIHLQAIPQNNVWRITDLYVSVEGRNNIQIDLKKDDFN